MLILCRLFRATATAFRIHRAGDTVGEKVVVVGEGTVTFIS